MPGLLLILTEAEGPRAAAAIEVAAASAALGRPVAVLLRGAALGADCSVLRELGVPLAACQTAMAEAGMGADDLADGVEPLGLVAFLSGREGWQILLG